MAERFTNDSDSGYEIDTDKARLDRDAIFAYLSRSYWATGRPRAEVERSIDNSLCFGLYSEGAQVGFARAVTDSATFAWLADVYVLEEHRGRGLSKWLMRVVVDYEPLAGVRWLLATRDAHGLYEQFGFAPLPRPEMFMHLRFKTPR